MLGLITQETKTNDNSTVIVSKPLKDMLLDSFIIALIACFSLWNGQILTLNELLPLIKAFVLSFIIQLGYYRGIKRVVNNG